MSDEVLILMTPHSWLGFMQPFLVDGLSLAMWVNVFALGCLLLLLILLMGYA